MEQQIDGSTLLTEGGPPAADGGNPAEGQGTPAPGTKERTGGAAEDWRAGLPEELRESPSLAKFKDPVALAKGYVHLEKLVGSDKVPKPVSDDDKEGWERWYAAAGRPEAPDKYEIEVPDPPKGVDVPYDKEEEAFWRKLAHENGLSQKQFANLWKVGVKTRLDQAVAWQTERQQAREKATEALKREWGQNYDGNVATARIGLKEFADPDFYQYLEETGLGNDPRMTRVFARIGQKLSGDGRLKGPRQSETQAVDLDKAIADYRSKYGKELFDRTHPDHDRRVKEYNDLFAQRYPEPIR
jgi:hypothetical protein